MTYGKLKKGAKIKLEHCPFPEAEVIRVLGEGGQGAVYEVNAGGKRYALKWYHAGKLKNKNAFRKNLRTNIEDPDFSMADCPKSAKWNFSAPSRFLSTTRTTRRTVPCKAFIIM